MPIDSPKKVEVMAKMMTDFSVQKQKLLLDAFGATVTTPQQWKSRSDAMSDEVKGKIASFYLRDDVSRMRL